MHTQPVVAADLTNALDAFRRARFREAAAILDRLSLRGETRSMESLVLLRARLHLKREPASALPYLAANTARLHSERARTEAALLAGAAYARLGDPAAAAAKFAVAASLGEHDGALALELDYQRAAAAWIARKLDLAQRLVVPVRQRATGDLALEAAVLEGAVAASRGNVPHQGAILLDALRVAREMPAAAVHPRAVIASQIAYLARELPSIALRDAAYAEVDAVAWTDELADLRFTMLRAVAWRHALDGDYFNAFRFLKRAAEVAPTDAWRVTAFADRAYFASVLGEQRWAEQELRDAGDLAAAVPWTALSGEERFALVILAELFAPRDAALALAYVARYKDVGHRFDRTLASSDDRRVAALESYGEGIVCAALGERAQAARLLRTAWKTYDAIGYDWRAGRTALALAGVTGDAAWTERARAKLVPYRNSWLARGAVDVARNDAAEVERLTRAQRAVYDLLLDGLSTAEIAARQGRSGFTVRNHIKAIFKAFGVNSRPALLARANARS